MPDKITDTLVRQAPVPKAGNRIIYDTQVKGFGIRTTAGGSKSFVLNYRAGRRERRITIGAYPDWSVLAAREKAKELKRRIDFGDDPLADKQTVLKAATVQDLWDRYETVHLPTKAQRSQKDDRSIFQKIIIPELGKHTRVDAISYDQILLLHRKISMDRPVRANRVIEVLRKALNLAIVWGWRNDNPAKGVKKNPETPRRRYLTEREAEAVVEALLKHPERNSADAIYLIMLTGARKGEVLSARWTEFDLEAGLWTKPSARTKQRRIHSVPVSSKALSILRERQSLISSEFVFPGKDASHALTDIKKSWRSIIAKATISLWRDDQSVDSVWTALHETHSCPPSIEELQKELKKQGITTSQGVLDVRIHDLRHSFASTIISSGGTLPVVGALLGHSQPSTTARYSHIYDEVQRDAAEIVARKLDRN